jgi:hypothetical protein
VLVVQGNQYFVLNDIFRYLGLEEEVDPREVQQKQLSLLGCNIDTMHVSDYAALQTLPSDSGTRDVERVRPQFQPSSNSDRQLTDPEIAIETLCLEETQSAEVVIGLNKSNCKTALQSESDESGSPRSQDDYEHDDLASESTACSSAAESDDDGMNSNKRQAQIMCRVFAQEVLKRIVHAVWGMLNAASGTTSATGSGPSSSTSHAPTDYKVPTSNAQRSKGKRPVRDVDDSDNDQDKKRDKRPQLGAKSPIAVLDLDQKFACPFHQRRPDENTRWPSCAAHGWDTVHRVK